MWAEKEWKVLVEGLSGLLRLLCVCVWGEGDERRAGVWGREKDDEDDSGMVSVCVWRMWESLFLRQMSAPPSPPPTPNANFSRWRSGPGGDLTNHHVLGPCAVCGLCLQILYLTASKSLALARAFRHHARPVFSSRKLSDLTFYRGVKGSGSPDGLGFCSHVWVDLDLIKSAPNFFVMFFRCNRANNEYLPVKAKKGWFNNVSDVVYLIKFPGFLLDSRVW